SSLEGVLGQRLVRRICPACRRPTPISPAVLAKLEAMSGKPLDGVFYEGAGCDECRGGYRGRIGIFELLAITPTLREMILQKQSAAQLRSHAQRSMMTMQQDAMHKAREGLTTLEEIVRVCASEAQE
ncbi:MAG: type II secretion system protein GspE, partial [Verrucomicrobiae bacterium]|nr:type II secretion system protein GspE [Verrucomicrobiae bacterium]